MIVLLRIMFQQFDSLESESGSALTRRCQAMLPGATYQQIASLLLRRVEMVFRDGGSCSQKDFII